MLCCVVGHVGSVFLFCVLLLALLALKYYVVLYYWPCWQFSLIKYCVVGPVGSVFLCCVLLLAVYCHVVLFCWPCWQWTLSY